MTQDEIISMAEKAGFFVNDKISSIRGTPRVTFDFEATPAK